MGSLNSTAANSAPFSKELVLPEILSKVFSSLCLEDLKNCRFVNRFWECIANEIMRKRVEVTLRPGFEMPNFLKVLNNRLENRTIPFNSFEINIRCDRPNEDNCKALLDFFEIHGKEIKCLKIIGDVSNTNHSDFGIHFGQILENCPFLKTLQYWPQMDIFSAQPNWVANTLTCLHYKVSFFRPNLPELKHILSGTPNIQNFIFTSYFSHQFTDEQTRLLAENLQEWRRKNGQIKTVSKILSNVYENGNLRFLSNLEFNSPLPVINTDNDLNLLIGMNLKLEKFSTLISNTVNFKLVYQLLEIMQESIKSLNLNIDLNKTNFEKQSVLPYLPALNHLTIHSSMISDDVFEKVPNLKTLTLLGKCNDAMQILGLDVSSQGSSFLLLNSIIFRQNEAPELPVAIIQKFCHLNLRDIQLVGDDEVLLEIYKTFPRLEKLIIYTSPRLTVRGFTGMIEEEMRERSLWPVPRRLSQEREKDILQKLWEAQFIGRLTALRQLEIREMDLSKSVTESCLPQPAVLLGILNCKSLTSLFFDVCLDKDCVDALSRLPYLQSLHATPNAYGMINEHEKTNCTTAKWYQNLLRKYPSVQIFVRIHPTEARRLKGYQFEFRRLQLEDRYEGFVLRNHRSLCTLKINAHGSEFSMFTICSPLIRRKCWSN